MCEITYVTTPLYPHMMFCQQKKNSAAPTIASIQGLALIIKTFLYMIHHFYTLSSFFLFLSDVWQEHSLMLFSFIIYPIKFTFLFKISNKSVVFLYFFINKFVHFSLKFTHTYISEILIYPSSCHNPYWWIKFNQTC